MYFQQILYLLGVNKYYGYGYGYGYRGFSNSVDSTTANGFKIKTIL